MDKQKILKILDEAKLTGPEKTRFLADFGTSSTLRGILDKLNKDEGIPPAAKENVVKSMAEKFREDVKDFGKIEIATKPTIIDKLENDLKTDPSAAKRFEDIARTNPDAVSSKIIPAYTGGNLSQALSAASPAAAPKVAGAEAAAVKASATEPAAPKRETPKASAPKAEPIKVTVAAPAATPEPLSAQDKQLFKDAFSMMTNKDDKTLAGAIDKTFVKDMAPAIADEAVSKYGVSKVSADAFTKRVQGDPKLQGEIAENFKRHPEFLRQMAKSMNDQGDLPAPAREMAKKKMDEVMQNPQLLADDKYVSNATSMMKNGGMLNGISSFFKNTFGIDASGMMSGMGGFFQGVMQWVQDFMGAFTGGAVKDFLSMPSNKNLGMFEKLSTGIGFAMQQAGNTYHSPYEMSALRVLPTGEGRDTYFHTEMRMTKDKNGHDTKTPKDVPNTIEIETVDGKKQNIIPTSGPMQYTQLPSGNISVRLATDATKGPGGVPNITKTGDFVVNPQEFNRMQADFALRGGENEFRPVVPGKQYASVMKMAPLTVAYVDREGGIVSPSQEIQAMRPVMPGFSQPATSIPGQSAPTAQNN